MNLDSFKNKIRYITNEQGIKTDIVIPLVMWDNILEALNLETSQDRDSKTEQSRNRVSTIILPLISKFCQETRFLTHGIIQVKLDCRLD